MLIATTSQMLRTLDDIRPADRPFVGGKAFNCARLKQAGFPAPAAIAVLPGADEDPIPSLADDPWIQSAPSGARFAVRSSGTSEDSAGDSFAGIHETRLNVTRGELADAVRYCRHSAQ